MNCYWSIKKGYYDSMDAGMMDEDGQIYVMSRDDDVINVAGHRLSTSALEEALLEHPCISEAAVIGVPDEMKGEVPLGLFVTTKGKSAQQSSSFCSSSIALSSPSEVK